MSQKPTVELSLGRGGRASVWKHFLPADSQVTESFLEPLTVVVEGPTHVGSPPEHPTGPMRVFVGDELGWQDTRDIFDTFSHLLPEILQCVTRLTRGCTTLVYFSGPATHEEMFSMWPLLPFGSRDDVRFYVSDVSRDSRTDVSRDSRTVTLLRIWLCLEYVYESFKRLLGPEGYEYSYGTTIMGMSVSEESVKRYLRRDPRDEGLLEESLRSDDIRCWWLCDADFDGMTIWHKDHAGDELAKYLKTVIEAVH